MISCIITTSSVTYAMKGQQLLARYAVPSEVVKIDNDKRKKSGCAYGIKVACSAVDSALALLEKNAIPYSGIMR